jgi:hypothetical protein
VAFASRETFALALQEYGSGDQERQAAVDGEDDEGDVRGHVRFVWKSSVDESRLLNSEVGE